MAAAGPAVASTSVADTVRLTLEAGAALEAHHDRLASPFRLTGAGVAFRIGYRAGGFSLDLGGGTARTSSVLDEPDRGEDVWTGALDLAYVRSVAGGDRTIVRVGASLSALGFVRRYHYGANAAREFYPDLIVPLSAVGEIRRRLGDATLVEERVALGVAAMVFRSPFHAAKTFPGGAFAGPGTLQVARHRLTLERALSPRLRLTVAHALTYYGTDRHRPVRVFHQEVRAGMAVLVGGGGR
jgi:hypothetical protein